MTNINYIEKFSTQNADAGAIIKELTDLTLAAMNRDYSTTGLVSKFSVDNYFEKNEKVKKAVLNFCTSACSLNPIVDKKSVALAFSNSSFEAIYNSIIAESLMGVMVRTQSPQIMAMANVEDVDLGDSYTWNIDPKGLPVAQRASYMSNVALLDSYAISPITVTPKPYSIGTTTDYLRMVNNGYDFGKEIARVAMGMLYAQYKLIVGSIFDPAGTPIYKPTFDPKTYVKTASDLSALNGNSGVTAYGTLVAWQAINSLATQGGFTTKDDYIRTNFLQKIYGVDSAIIEQATDLSSPLVAGTPTTLVPEDKLVLLSSVGDKPCKLVRENYIRVIRDDHNTTSLHRTQYSYFMSFDVALATQAHYGLQNVAGTP